MIRLQLNEDDTVDEVVAENAYVHLEDLGDSFMLIVETDREHVHVTIPLRRRFGRLYGKWGLWSRAFVFERFTKEGT